MAVEMQRLLKKVARQGFETNNLHYATGARIVADMVTVLEEEGLLPPSLSNSTPAPKEKPNRKLANVGNTVRLWRKQVNMTQQELATRLVDQSHCDLDEQERHKQIGAQRSMIAQLETQRYSFTRPLNIERLMQKLGSIAGAFDMTASDLLEGSPLPEEVIIRRYQHAARRTKRENNCSV